MSDHGVSPLNLPVPWGPPATVTVRWARVHPKMGTDALPWPARKSALAAGYDLAAALDSPFYLQPRTKAVIALGFKLALPRGWEAQMRPRSGLASKHGITCLNSPGTIDADYRGEVKAILYNASEEIFVIQPAMRVAQMLIAPVPEVRFLEDEAAFDEATGRGEGGFGSTGA